MKLVKQLPLILGLFLAGQIGLNSAWAEQNKLKIASLSIPGIDSVEVAKSATKTAQSQPLDAVYMFGQSINEQIDLPLDIILTITDVIAGRPCNMLRISSICLNQMNRSTYISPVNLNLYNESKK